MLRSLVSLLALMLAMTFAPAQPDPAMQPPGNPPMNPGPGRQFGNPGMGMGSGGFAAPQIPQGGMRNMEVEVTENGLFILTPAMLAKFDPMKLSPQGSLSLTDLLPKQEPPMPEPMQQPGMNGEQGMVQRRMSSPLRQIAQPAMLANGDSLYLVAGDLFLRINQKTMAVEAKSNLTGEEAAPGQQPMRGMGPVTLKLQGQTLYVIRGGAIYALNASTGEVIARGQLPREMMPMQQGPRNPMGPGNPPGQPNQMGQPNWGPQQ